MFDRAISVSGMSHAQVALALGVSRERVGDWCDPSHESRFTLGDLLVLQRRLPTLFAEVITQLSELAGVRAYERERRSVEREARRAITALEDVVRDLKGEEG